MQTEFLVSSDRWHRMVLYGFFMLHLISCAIVWHHSVSLTFLACAHCRVFVMPCKPTQAGQNEQIKFTDQHCGFVACILKRGNLCVSAGWTVNGNTYHICTFYKINKNTFGCTVKTKKYTEKVGAGTFETAKKRKKFSGYKHLKFNFSYSMSISGCLWVQSMGHLVGAQDSHRMNHNATTEQNSS